MAGLKVGEYADKYNIPVSTVYGGLYRGRISGEKTEEGWRLEDAAPRMKDTKRDGTLPTGYDLALMWFNGSIMEDAIVIRSQDPFVPRYLAEKVGGSVWQRDDGQHVCKISSLAMVREMQDAGFTGRKDARLLPPPVDDESLSAALIESHAALVRQLRYWRGHSGDRAYGYYVPAISICASVPIMEAFSLAMTRLGLMPPRRTYPASNGTSATIKITSKQQLDDIHAALSSVGKDAAFWARLDEHIAHPLCGNDTDGNKKG